MKNENEIKRAFAMEVIEYINELYINGKTHPYVYINDIKQKLYTMMRPEGSESILTKEEENKTESDEVKVGDDCWLSKTGGVTHNVRHIIGDEAWVVRNHDNFGFIAKISTLYNTITSEPTLEQKARKKAEEIWKDWQNNPDRHFQSDAIYEALLIDPKTL
jgi:hypothetical protein